MELSSVLISLNTFSFFIFLALFLSSFRNKERFKEFKSVLISSFFMFASITMLFLERTSFSNDGYYTVLYTFFTFSMLHFSVLYTANLIKRLNPSKTEIHLTGILLYAIIVGILFSLNSLWGSYLIRNYLFLMTLSFPLYLIVYYIIQSPIQWYKSPFTYQIIIFLILYTIKIIDLYLNPSTSYSVNTSTNTAHTMFSIIILITFQLTYLFEHLNTMNYNLKINSNILEDTLQETKAKSMIDPLTNLYNRVMLENTLHSYHKDNSNSEKEFIVAMIDIRHFKKVNDSYGHRMGDQVLTDLSIQLRNTIRNDDIVGRWGGDEFLIIFPHAKIESFDSLRAKIVENISFDDLKIPSNLISLSIGFASIKECSSIEELIHLADLRMYLQRNINIKKSL